MNKKNILFVTLCLSLLTSAVNASESQMLPTDFPGKNKTLFTLSLKANQAKYDDLGSNYKNSELATEASARFGLNHDTEILFSFPFNYKENKINGVKTDANGIGDAKFGIHWKPFTENSITNNIKSDFLSLKMGVDLSVDFSDGKVGLNTVSVLPKISISKNIYNKTHVYVSYESKLWEKHIKEGSHTGLVGINFDIVKDIWIDIHAGAYHRENEPSNWLPSTKHNALLAGTNFGWRVNKKVQIEPFFDYVKILKNGQLKDSHGYSGGLKIVSFL